MGKLAINGGKPVRRKPFPVYPVFGEAEVRAVARVIRSGELCSGMTDGEVRKFEDDFAAYQNSKFALAVSNGTTALHIALAAGGIGVGDEVIVPPYTFLATATSVLMNNAIPVFADIERQTLGLDPRAVAAKITPRTRAVIPVHMNGYPCDLQGILALARKHRLVVIEDCAHAHGAEYKRRKVGTLGDIGIFSFQQKKNLSLGEGGLLVTDNPKIAGRARGLRSFGKNVNLAYNYRMSELHGALGRVRLKRLDAENAVRIRNAAYLRKKLAGLKGLTTQAPRANTTAVYYNFVARYSPAELGVDRQKFVAAVQAEGVPLPGIYYPLYRHPTFRAQDAYGRGCPFTCPFYKAAGGQRPDYGEGACPVAEETCDHRNIEIKIHPPASLQDMDDIAAAFAKVIDNIGELRQTGRKD